MVKINLKLFKKQAQTEIKKSRDLKSLNDVFSKYLGKKGTITLVFRSLEKLPKKERIKVGKRLNELKFFLKREFEQKKLTFVKATTDETEWIDVTVPGKRPTFGHLHPLTLVKRKVEEIFQSMGFSVVEGPEIENEWYNFDALNIPKDHPTRDVLSLGKTLYLKGGNLMRSHTSAVQVRYLEKNNPPLRIIAPGKVFRQEATDASHDLEFWHVEGLMVGKDISVANFKAIIKEFFKKFFGKEMKIRMRPSYFPFVEPGFEIDITCLTCCGRGCSACQQAGWLEMIGAGMVHPAVLKNSGLNPKFWQGFAFGMGLDRLTMMKYKINDIRLFRSSDLRFLKQF